MSRLAGRLVISGIGPNSRQRFSFRTIMPALSSTSHTARQTHEHESALFDCWNCDIITLKIWALLMFHKIFLAGKRSDSEWTFTVT